MRAFHCFILFLLCITYQASAQEKIDIGNSERGILLDSGWKFHPGDHPAWAQPLFDDRQWQTVNPAADIHNLVPLRKAEIGWFRLHLKVDSALLNKPLALLIRQMGASELYLNGERILRLGHVSQDRKKEVVYNPNDKPYTFQFSGGTEQVLAVRYSFTTRNLYFNNELPGNSALVIQLLPADAAFNLLIHEKRHSIILRFVRVGFLLLLFLIHLFFYIYYPENRTNLYYSLFALYWMFGNWLWYAANDMPREGNSYFIIKALIMLAELPGLFFALTAVYSHARQPKGFLYWFVFLCLLLTYPTARWPYEWGWLMVYVYILALVADAIRVSALAKRNRIAGAGIILFGWIVFLLSTGFAMLMFLDVIKQENLGLNYRYIQYFTYHAGFLFLWLPFSIILARDFAKTNRSLKERLQEVEALSAKTIEQEKEKQQLLANQNLLLEQQVTDRTAALKQSLEELKSTQAYLIQREKMASLGELTAGIAHEIQNPLNFVNNFSEVNRELMEELKMEAQSGNINEVLQIANEIKENEQKIAHHGKRADAIVKGMLQHSRTSSGEKQLTNINALADEYLRLSYQAIRSKDKNFNAIIKTHFDDSIGKINIVPQDIGRVLMNLFNNSFYAVQQKKQQVNGDFEPVVTVSTNKLDNKVRISVKDNGTGIPQKLADKIFQPFFTTKPTGEGTGLGLSLSYDIVKAHGGELMVNSKECEYAEFIVQIPVETNHTG